MLSAAISAPVGAAIVTAMLFVAGFVLRYVLRLQSERMTTVKHEHVDNAKDELIDTLQANHEALSDRVELLEGKAKSLDQKLAAADAEAESLRLKLADMLADYRELQKYAAPEAVKTLMAMLDTFSHTTNALLADVLERLTDVETRQDSGFDSLAQALNLLRQTVATNAPQK